MVVAYLDTSAAMKLLYDEGESDALDEALSARAGVRMVSAWLLHTELHCAVGRRGGVTSEALATVLETIELIDVRRGDFLSAGTLAPLRSQDALHLAVAMGVGADEIITYDAELADAARGAGLRVWMPGV